MKISGLKTHISNARTKLIAVRKVVEADRMRRLEPLRQGLKRTLKLELDHAKHLTTKLIEKITEDEHDVLKQMDEEDVDDEETIVS